jgi:hypothetical protein
MSTDITACGDIAARMEELGCAYPTSGIALLPVNFATASQSEDLLQASEAATVKKLLKEAGIPVDDVFGPGRRPMYIKNKSSDWAAPILLVSAALYSQNPTAVSVALNIIGNYATDFLRGRWPGRDEAKLDIVVQTKGTKSFKRISYSGPADGIRGLDGVVRKVFDD